MNIKGTDLSGAGKIAKAIPQKSWHKLVITSCDVFESIILPITATTSGIGRLIKAKFDQLIDEEKVITAEVFKIAETKAHASKKKKKKEANPRILISVINHASVPTDSNIRELWSNLLAQEISEGGVHPEIPNILTRINSDDAIRLIEIADKAERYGGFELSLSKFKSYFMNVGIGTLSIELKAEPDTFSEKLLENLNLIEKIDSAWVLTAIGRGFISAVTDPSQN